jgi:hypothetical protein
MVTRFFPATCLEIDARGNEPSGYGWAEKEVIDPQPGITGERVSEVLPEGTDALSRVATTRGSAYGSPEIPLFTLIASI